MADNNLNAVLRKMQRDGQGLQQQVEVLKAVVNTLKTAYSGSALKALTNRERALAGARDMRPSWFIIEHAVDNAGTAADNTEKQVDTVGRFVVDRIRVAWRASGGTDTGKFGHGSSAQNPDLNSTNVVDFSVEFVDGRNSLHLQNRMIPGDLFFRNDGDGFSPGGLVLEGGTDFKIIVTPHRAWPSDGYLIFVFEGIQTYDQVGNP